MKLLLSFILASTPLVLLNAQSTLPSLNFEQARVFDIGLNVKTTIAQQAMGQAIDFTVDATGDHRFTVTNATTDNTTLHYDFTRLRFSFEGMGQKRNFDSSQETDMKGPFGPYAKEILDKKYDMIIDPQGQTLMVIPETITFAVSDPRLAIIHSMLRDVISLTFPPPKGEPGFFQLFPNETLKPGLAWTRSSRDSSGGSLTEVYRIVDINDSTILIDFSGESVTVTKAEMMGNPTTTTLNNKSTGTMIVDASTLILKEKNQKTESHGTSETPFGAIPVTAKSEMKLVVSPSGK